MSQCIHYHVNIIIKGCPKDWWDECKHTKGGLLWLKDGAIQVGFIRWWKRLQNWSNINRGGQTMDQLLELGHEHERMQVWWMLDIPLERMIKRVCWCKHSIMESLSHLICLLMRCSKESNYWGNGNNGNQTNSS
jgi:hypothetical protein